MSSRESSNVGTRDATEVECLISASESFDTAVEQLVYYGKRVEIRSRYLPKLV